MIESSAGSNFESVEKANCKYISEFPQSLTFESEVGHKVTQDPYLKRTASITLSPGKTVQVVTIGDKGYIVGVSDSGVNLIGELTDKELIDAMNLNAEKEPTGKRKDFSSMLASFTKSSESTEAYLRNKREKLQNSEDDK